MADLTLREVRSIHGGLIKEISQIGGTVGAILILWGLVELFKSSKNVAKTIEQTKPANEKKEPNTNMQDSPSCGY